MDIKSKLKEFLVLHGIEINNNKFCCLWHDDTNPSMGIEPSGTNAHCFSCGTNADIYSFAAIFYNLDIKIEFNEIVKRVNEELGVINIEPESVPVTIPFNGYRNVYTDEKIIRMGEYVFRQDMDTALTIEDIYPCRNEAGHVEFIEVRFKPECFKDGKKRTFTLWYNGFSIRAKSPPHGLFGRELLTDKEKPILIVEGPKCQKVASEALSESFIPIAWNGGCNGQKSLRLLELKGRNVFIYPDDDQDLMKMPEEQNGIKSANITKDKLKDIAKSVTIVQPVKEARKLKRSGADIVEALQVMPVNELVNYIMIESDNGEGDRDEYNFSSQVNHKDLYGQVKAWFSNHVLDNYRCDESVQARCIESAVSPYVKHDGNTWLVYDEVSGCYDPLYSESIVYDLVKIFAQERYNTCESSSVKEEQAKKSFARTMSSARGISSVMKILTNNKSIISNVLDYDTNENSVNCNGILYFCDGSKIRKSTPDDMNTMHCMVIPEEGEPIEWNRFITWATCGDKELEKWIHTYLGISLFGHPTDKIVNFYGSGGNGKGTVIRVISNIMGKYYTPLPRGVVIKSNFNATRFDSYCLLNRRLAGLSDLKTDRGEKPYPYLV
ncbi:hypothetical protein FACS1894200_10330 [Spirochaetia bacterium]|nr:hypothetical protein FACS1894200_10330 [Spirochaetia bacterium]